MTLVESSLFNVIFIISPICVAVTLKIDFYLFSRLFEHLKILVADFDQTVLDLDVVVAVKVIVPNDANCFLSGNIQINLIFGIAKNREIRKKNL